MGLLRREEVLRLLKYLRERIEDPDQLAQIEDELSGEFAEEFIREPEILAFFPQLSDEFFVAATRWKLRVIPHAHLRMIQRGMRLSDVSGLFRRFIETFSAVGEEVIVGGYVISGRPKARMARITVRADVDTVDDESGQAHVVTIYLGRGQTEDTTEINLT
jgi:hypothetical protein